MGSFYGQFNFTGYLNLRTEYSFDSNTSLNKGFMPTYQFGVRINNINKIYQLPPSQISAEIGVLMTSLTVKVSEITLSQP